jgi:hypothetical protein
MDHILFVAGVGMFMVSFAALAISTILNMETACGRRDRAKRLAQPVRETARGVTGVLQR